MPRPSRQKEGGYRPPTAVADFTALDAALADYIVEGSVAASTHSAIKGFWGLWERHCEDHKVNPLDAPWAAWQELENLRRDDGRRYNGQLIGAILNAVEHHYRQNGVTAVPAPRRPEHALDWEAVRREWTTVTNEAKGRSTPGGEGSEVELRPVVPMMRQDALALLAVPLDAPAWRDHRRASFVQQRAELLVAIETRAPAWQLERVVLGDIEVRGDGGVAFSDFALPCDHRERVRGVPWDCSACAVLDAVAARPGDGPEVSFVLGVDPGGSEKRQRADARARFRGGMVRVRGRWGGAWRVRCRVSRSAAR